MNLTLNGRKVFFFITIDKFYSSLQVGILCSSRKLPYPPHGRSSEMPRGRGFLKVKILEVKYGAKLEFPGGRWGAKQKNFP